MERQNVTLSLPKVLLRKAKVMAAKEDKSLSGLFIEAIEEKVREDAGFKKARGRQLRLLKAGLNLGTQGHRVPSREELHDRR